MSLRANRGRWDFGVVISLFWGLALAVSSWAQNADTTKADFHRAKWDPIHFKPAIETATDKQCLQCHQSVLTATPRDTSPAGVKAKDVKAWYQTLDTYSGDQDSFHRRHLVTPLAKDLMRMKCNTCHQGSEPREKTPAYSDNSASHTFRMSVNPTTCHMCHGQFDPKVMNLPAPWKEARDTFQNNCLLCHAAIRTERHKVNFLNAEAIEAAGKKSGDSCYGCHGGRAWYRTPFPFPRHAWTGMDKEVPEWAKSRPTTSNSRFLDKTAAPSASTPAVAKDMKK